MLEELKRILQINIGNKKIPVEHIFYTGNSKTFITWTIISEKPGLVANDDVLEILNTVDIDIYSDGNYTKIADEVKRIMKENDWVWTETSVEMYEADTKLYHRTYTFEK